MKSTAGLTKSAGIPAYKATFLACKFMCPLCIPYTDIALKAAKFYANPTESIT